MTADEIADANAVWEILRDALDGTPQRVTALGPRPVAGEPELRVILPGGRELTLVPRGAELPVSLREAAARRSCGDPDCYEPDHQLPPPLPDLTGAEADAFVAALDQARQTAAHCACRVNNECECKGESVVLGQGGEE